jgi:hypothetical protein
MITTKVNNMSKKMIPTKSTQIAQERALNEQPQSTLGRRSFLKRIGLGGAAALLPAGGWLASEAVARADGNGGGITRGDVAILRFLAAAEILEADLWQQYNELALGNTAFQQALQVLDGDMPPYRRFPSDRFFVFGRPPVTVTPIGRNQDDLETKPLGL